MLETQCLVVIIRNDLEDDEGICRLLRLFDTTSKSVIRNKSPLLQLLYAYCILWVNLIKSCTYLKPNIVYNNKYKY